MAGEVVIDARPLQGRSGARGIGTYVRGLLSALAAEPPRQGMAFLVDASLPAAELPSGFSLHEVRRRWHGRLAAYEDAAVLGGDLDRLRPALYHATSLSLPSRGPCPVVVTLHDLIPWAWGGPWMVGERIRHYPGKRLLRRAEGVIAVSEATAADALAHAGVPRERLEVIAEGVAPTFHPATGSQERVQTRWSVRAPFLLYVGALDRRKDPVGLVRAWRAAQRAGLEAELVIAGEPGAQAPGRMGGARQLGRVTDDELADLYRAAACLLFPSRYEGFGLPLLEAMACGCPVAAYDNSSIPEVVKGTGELVRDGDALALGRAAARIALDPQARREAARRGPKRAQTFTWQRAARATSRVYDRLCGNLPKR